MVEEGFVAFVVALSEQWVGARASLEIMGVSVVGAVKIRMRARRSQVGGGGDRQEKRSCLKSPGVLPVCVWVFLAESGSILQH